MTTVQYLIDKTYRQILEPPSAQPALTSFATGLTIGNFDFTRGDFEIPEDENLLRLGSVIEAGQELMRVSAYDSALGTVTVRRAVLGTVEEDHAIGDPIKLSPPFTRLDVFDAVRNNIISLYPRLWTVKTYTVSAVNGGSVFTLPDPLIVELIEAQPDQQIGGSLNFHGRIVDYHQFVDGRALILNTPIGGQVWARFRRRFGVAVAESDVLEDLGLDSVWEQIVVVGAAADVLAGRDVPEVNTEWVQSTLEAENIRVGSRLSLAAGLGQYRDLLLNRFANEMLAEDSSGVAMQMNDPFQQVAR